MPEIMTAISAASGIKGFMDSGKNEGLADDAVGMQGMLAGKMATMADMITEEWENVWRPLEREQAKASRRMLPMYEKATATGIERELDQGKRYDTLYRPIEDTVLADVGRDPQARIEDAAGRAIAGVDAQFDSADRDLARRNFTRGLSPDDTVDGTRQSLLARASARAAEGTRAAESERARSLSERIGALQQAPGQQPYIPGIPTKSSAHTPQQAISALATASNAQGGIADHYMGKAETGGMAAGEAIKYLDKKSGDISAFFS
jgi:hypothetical protein